MNKKKIYWLASGALLLALFYVTGWGHHLVALIGLSNARHEIVADIKADEAKWQSVSGVISIPVSAGDVRKIENYLTRINNQDCFDILNRCLLVKVRDDNNGGLWTIEDTASATVFIAVTPDDHDARKELIKLIHTPWVLIPKDNVNICEQKNWHHVQLDPHGYPRPLFTVKKGDLLLIKPSDPNAQIIFGTKSDGSYASCGLAGYIPPVPDSRDIERQKGYWWPNLPLGAQGLQIGAAQAQLFDRQKLIQITDSVAWVVGGINDHHKEGGIIHPNGGPCQCYNNNEVYVGVDYAIIKPL